MFCWIRRQGGQFKGFFSFLGMLFFAFLFLFLILISLKKLKFWSSWAIKIEIEDGIYNSSFGCGLS